MMGVTCTIVITGNSARSSARTCTMRTARNSATAKATTKPVTAKGAPATAVTLGNISDLIREVTRLYGNKRIWITEYGYQTNPPDSLFGVSWTQQAAYLLQAFALARKNPRIDMMLWFLLKDEPGLGGWQSGLVTFGGRRKPAYAAFMRMAAATRAAP